MIKLEGNAGEPIVGSVSDNDLATSGGTLTYAVETDVENGALTFNADGTYNYTPILVSVVRILLATW